MESMNKSTKGPTKKIWGKKDNLYCNKFHYSLLYCQLFYTTQSHYSFALLFCTTLFYYLNYPNTTLQHSTGDGMLQAKQFCEQRGGLAVNLFVAASLYQRAVYVFLFKPLCQYPLGCFTAEQ